ncbi:hypothetical protein GGX14DRAFT_372903 [Mycena pura]|uniref:SWIM-type domain-containing protein n=1 Tax=Mycena pura TaxID=153505 RepID=A0AAD6Y8L7_9AGAR|nr:hypothetical protein GGX14DRAFT_372903 [Mycena pura]
MKQLLNLFTNDKARVYIAWLIHLVCKHRFTISHILKIMHQSTSVFHYIAVLSDQRYMCDCSMEPNLGIPCWHYFRVWIDVQ